MMKVQQGLRTGTWTLRKLYQGREERAIATLLGISDILRYRHSALIENYRSLLSATKVQKLEQIAS